MARWTIHGYAVVSDDGMIADQSGRFPDALMNFTDWEYFQSELDKCSATVLGRVSHENVVNTRNRLRVVVTASSSGLSHDEMAWWWSPSSVSVPDMLEQVVPLGGRIGVPGGRRVFDLFLEYGFDEFHLTRCHGVKLPGGVPVFSAVTSETSPEAVLEKTLVQGHTKTLDEGVDITVWKTP